MEELLHQLKSAFQASSEYHKQILKEEQQFDKFKFITQMKLMADELSHHVFYSKKNFPVTLK